MQKINDETLARKNNMKIFPWYRMLSWDLLFFYSISFLFFVDVKGLSPAQVILADAFYPLFKFLLEPISMLISEKLGKRKSIILGNCFVTLYLILILFCPGFKSIVLATFFCSFGFVIKNMCETNFLYESIPHCKNRGEIFGKLDGKGFSRYYIFDGITSFFTGFTYVINPYLPIVISIIINSIATYLAYKLCEIPKSNTEQLKEKSTKNLLQISNEFFRDFKYGFRYVLKSDRLRSLLMIYSLFYGILALTLTLRRSLLEELNISAEYFGIIFAIMGFIAAISAKKQNWFHNKFRNRTITALTVPYCVSCILLGIVSLISINFNVKIAIILLIFTIHYIVRGPFYTLIKRYLNNFSTTKARNKIYSVTTLFESLVASLITILGALIVEYLNTAYAFILIGIVSTTLVLMLLKYMKTRVGLKPEEYKKSEIEMLNLK